MQIKEKKNIYCLFILIVIAVIMNLVMQSTNGYKIQGIANRLTVLD